MKSVIKSVLAAAVLVPTLAGATPLGDLQRDGSRREIDRTRGDDRRDMRDDRGRHDDRRRGGRIDMSFSEARDVADRMYIGALGRRGDSNGLYNMANALRAVRTVDDLTAVCRDFLYKWPEFDQHERQVGARQVDADIDSTFGGRGQVDFREVDLIQRGRAEIVLVDAIRNFIRQ